jgi:phosphoglucosamine mutase
MHGMSKLPQVMVNVTVDDPKSVAVCNELKKAIEREEAQLGARGRTLVRASGTEPLLRVMVEGEDADEVQEIANRLAIVAEGQN